MMASWCGNFWVMREVWTNGGDDVRMEALCRAVRTLGESEG